MMLACLQAVGCGGELLVQGGVSGAGHVLTARSALVEGVLSVRKLGGATLYLLKTWYQS
jgi:hypothetical protein